jgi:hypothetical protein
MYCVTTRFHLKHCWDLLPIYFSYRKMLPDLRSAPGLLRYAFLLESPTACCTLSIWQSEAAIIAFSNVHSHIRALRRAKRWCHHIWSAYWQIDAISKYSNAWPGSVPWPSLVEHPLYPHRLAPAQVKEGKP